MYQLEEGCIDKATPRAGTHLSAATSHHSFQINVNKVHLQKTSPAMLTCTEPGGSLCLSEIHHEAAALERQEHWLRRGDSLYWHPALLNIHYVSSGVPPGGCQTGRGCACKPLSGASDAAAAPQGQHLTAAVPAACPMRPAGCSKRRMPIIVLRAWEASRPQAL